MHRGGVSQVKCEKEVWEVKCKKQVLEGEPISGRKRELSARSKCEKGVKCVKQFRLRRGVKCEKQSAVRGVKCEKQE